VGYVFTGMYSRLEQTSETEVKIDSALLASCCLCWINSAYQFRSYVIGGGLSSARDTNLGHWKFSSLEFIHAFMIPIAPSL
jgi:hypothetical protein